MAAAERDYFIENVHTCINMLVDVLIVLIQESSVEDVNSIQFINKRWCNLYDLWMNSNVETALDDQWITSMFDVTVSKQQPVNFKLVYKMFVLSNIIKAEILGLKLPSYASLPQYSYLYTQFKR